MKYYGSHNCPDCVNFKGYLDANHIPYEFIDINASMANLKAFLRLRDQNELFDEVRQNGSVGIPCIFDEDRITLDYEAWLKEKGIEITSETKTVCRLDGKGC